MSAPLSPMEAASPAAEVGEAKLFPPEAVPANARRNFSLLWIGQMAVLLGAAMTDFALGIWAVRHSGSVSSYTTVVLFAVLPGLFVAPWAGSLADRCDRRRLAIAAELASAACIACIAAVAAFGTLALSHVYAVAAGLSVCSTILRVVYAASVAGMVPKEQLGRAGGLLQLAAAASQLAAPALAGVAIGHIALSGVLWMHLAAIGLAVATLLAIRFPALGTVADGAAPLRGGLADLAEAWAYLRGRGRLLLMLGYMAVEQFVVAGVMVLLAPMVLARYSEAALGMLVSCAGAGLLVGSIGVSALGTPRRVVPVILVVDVLVGLLVASVGLADRAAMLGAALFAMSACAAVSGVCDQVLWQTVAPARLHGRLLALRQMLTLAATPAATVVGGWLADVWFEPALRPGGAWAVSAAGAWVGTGPGRGISLMFVLAGLLSAAVALPALAWPALRRLESDALYRAAIAPSLGSGAAACAAACADDSVSTR